MSVIIQKAVARVRPFDTHADTRALELYISKYATLYDITYSVDEMSARLIHDRENHAIMLEYVIVFAGLQNDIAKFKTMLNEAISKDMVIAYVPFMAAPIWA